MTGLSVYIVYGVIHSVHLQTCYCW
jgi:hypothetical protein